MSYIINTTNPFVSIKLTEKGRMQLAKGQLNFSYYAFGDSEINYDREAVVDANQSVPTLSGSSVIMRPFDQQPNIKSFITKTSGEHLNSFIGNEISVVKAVVNNRAATRGFFSAVTDDQLLTYTSSTYVVGAGTVANTSLTGGTTLIISSAITRNVGDYMLLRAIKSSTTTDANDIQDTLTPIPYLWFKILSSNATSVTVDRALPNYSNQTGKNSSIIIYPSGEVHNAFGSGTTVAYWDSGTLSFDASSNISCCAVPVWNQNNVFCENLAGMTGLTTTALYEDYKKFGSYAFLGQKNPYMEYPCADTSATTGSLTCNPTGGSYIDDISKSIAILHYTNNTISNYYGEFLYIDNSTDKTVIVNTPTLMYHRRNFSTGAGTDMGMRFIASGTTQHIGSSDIEYIDLIEDPTLISGTPLVVGRVFPQLKLIVFSNDEIVAAMSYKSNRNWTLPELSANLISASGGTNSGILQPTETMYLTYQLESNTGTGLTTNLPCQNYIKIDNNSPSSKDVTFRINDVDLLPYMRKIEAGGYDGLGFEAYKMNVLYQIVSEPNQRPDSGAWRKFDFTSTAITTTASTTINPILLENQNPIANGFVITTAINTASTVFDITNTLNMSLNTSGGSQTLQFGDERFFYGNVDAYIGATIFKTIFGLTINSGQFNKTTNPTRSQDNATNPPNLKVSEVGVYDSDQNLVVIGKLSEPTALIPGDTIMLELSLDF